MAKVPAKKPDGEVHPYEVAPHDVELDHGLGSESTGEAVGYVHLPHAGSAAQRMTQNQGRLSGRGDCDKTSVSLLLYGDSVIITEVIHCQVGQAQQPLCVLLVTQSSIDTFVQRSPFKSEI